MYDLWVKCHIISVGANLPPILDYDFESGLSKLGLVLELRPACLAGPLAALSLAIQLRGPGRQRQAPIRKKRSRSHFAL